MRKWFYGMATGFNAHASLCSTFFLDDCHAVENSMSIDTCATQLAVADVQPATEPLRESTYHRGVVDFLGAPVESCSRYHGRLVRVGERVNQLVATLDLAFNDHRPISLSPDMIWLTLCQGLAIHINVNAEKLRSHFVRDGRQQEIVVVRNDFIKGTPENDWPGVFAEFSQQICEYIGDSHGLIVADFSTTGPVERAASEIVLMDAMQVYFKYIVYTRCGIPSITLEGNVKDWRSIHEGVRRWREFDLAWWIEPLLPLLERFACAAEGEVDRTFWRLIYRSEEQSGSSPTSGWIKVLFPYLLAATAGKLGYQPNPWLQEPFSDDGPDLGDFPHQPPMAPFTWVYLGTRYPMEFLGGLMGVAQDQRTLCLRPEIGWAVRKGEP